MRLPLLALPSLALLALCACSDPEPAPSPATPGAEPAAQDGQGGPGPQAGAGEGPQRRPGETHVSPNVAEGQVAAERPEQKNIEPMPPPGEPTTTQFETGDASVTITVAVDGFSPDAELQIVELVKGDFGMVRPRVVHIEPLKGRQTLEIAAPAKLPGKFYALVMEGELPNSKVSGAEQSLSLNGKDLSLKISAGQQATWMSQLPLGPPPENTLTEVPVPPESARDGDRAPAPK